MRLSVWVREDRNSKFLHGPGEGGPPIQAVLDRETIDLNTGEVLERRRGIMDLPEDERHRQFAEERDTRTTFWYDPEDPLVRSESRPD